MNLKKISVTMSYILRHGAHKMKLPIDNQGWMEISVLIDALQTDYPEIDATTIEQIVQEDTKGRYIIRTESATIRANQGHSMDLELKFQKRIPPDVLYHGTATKNALSIAKIGLSPHQRHHVHLSDNIDTAWEVGARHGRPMVFQVDARAMWTDGADFFISDNGVWLTAAVLPPYLTEVKWSNNEKAVHD